MSEIHLLWVTNPPIQRILASVERQRLKSLPMQLRHLFEEGKTPQMLLTIIHQRPPQSLTVGFLQRVHSLQDIRQVVATKQHLLKENGNINQVSHFNSGRFLFFFSYQESNSPHLVAKVLGTMRKIVLGWGG